MIKNRNEARRKIFVDAAARAQEYLEREIPETLDAIRYYVRDGASEREILNEIEDAYGPTEERVRHKILLVIRYLINAVEAE